MHLHFFYDEELPNRYAASIQILQTGAAFAALGHAFTFHCSRLTRARAEILADYGIAADSPVVLHQLFPSHGFPAPLRSARLRWRLGRLLLQLGRAKGDHVLMTRGASAASLLPTLEALAQRSARARPLIVHEMHNLQFLRQAEKEASRSLCPQEIDDPRYQALREREGRLLAVADGIVGLTPQVIRAVEEIHELRAPHIVLPSGTERPEARERPAAPSFDVVYAGKIEQRKGLHDLVAAMAHLGGKTLAIAGGPESAAEGVRALAGALGVADRVTLMGILPPARVAPFLLSGRVGVCPLKRGVDSVSDKFTSPLKLLQMMALGMPIVASDVAPVRALVTDGQEALLAPADDPRALAAAIGRLLDRPEEARRLGAMAQRRAEAFTWAQRARTLEGFLQALLQTRRAA